MGSIGYLHHLQPEKWKATVPDLGIFTIGENKENALDRMKTVLKELDHRNEVKVIDNNLFFIDFKKDHERHHQ